MGKSLLSCFFDSRCRDRKEERVVRLINAIRDKAVGACVKLIYSRKQANPFDCSWNPALHPHTNPPSIRSMQIWWQGLRELQRPTTIQNDRIRLTALWTTVLSVLIHDEAWRRWWVRPKLRSYCYHRSFSNCWNCHSVPTDDKFSKSNVPPPGRSVSQLYIAHNSKRVYTTAWLSVKIFCTKVVGATSSEGFPVWHFFQKPEYRWRFAAGI